jgi:hypothetical protein
LAKRGRDLFGYAFEQLKLLLEDKVLKVREAVAFVFRKLSSKDDGAQRMVEQGCAEAMIHSFIGHSKDAKHLSSEDGVYLIHLLEGFVHLTFSDLGITPLLGTGAVHNFNRIISENYVKEILDPIHKQKIQ